MAFSGPESPQRPGGHQIQRRGRRATINLYMAPAAELIQIDIGPRQPAPKPEWLKARAPMGENYHNLKALALTELGSDTFAVRLFCKDTPIFWTEFCRLLNVASWLARLACWLCRVETVFCICVRGS